MLTASEEGERSVSFNGAVNCRGHTASVLHQYNMNVELFFGTILMGKAEVLGETPVRMPLCPGQISQGPAWDRNLVSAATGRQLTT